MTEEKSPTQSRSCCAPETAAREAACCAPKTERAVERSCGCAPCTCAPCACASTGCACC